jgi:uridine kinase
MSLPGSVPPRPAFVVAVSGTSGAGKSTLITQAASRLVSATRLHLDDYIILGNDVEEITDWLERGGDPNGLTTPRLVADLRQLIGGRAVITPRNARLVNPASVIIVEEPFGRSRREMAPLIDLAVHLEVPPEVALGRRVLRAIQAHAGSPLGGGYADLVADIAGQLQAFLAIGRKAYQAAERSARGAADAVLDGLRPIDELIEWLVAEIRSRP